MSLMMTWALDCLTRQTLKYYFPHVFYKNLSWLVNNDMSMNYHTTQTGNENKKFNCSDLQSCLAVQKWGKT